MLGGLPCRDHFLWGLDYPFGIIFGIFDPVWNLRYPFGIIFGIFDPVWASDYPSGIVFGIFDPVGGSDGPFGIVFGIFDPVWASDEVRPFCWTDLTIRLIVLGPVLNRAHSVQLFLDPILVVVTQIFIKFFQEVLDGVELLQI